MQRRQFLADRKESRPVHQALQSSAGLGGSGIACAGCGSSLTRSEVSGSGGVYCSDCAQVARDRLQVPGNYFG